MDFSYDVHVLLAKLLVGEDGCHLMINLFCELWKSLMYFSQGILRGTRRSCFLRVMHLSLCHVFAHVQFVY